MNSINFDMDGTLANLYAVDGWLEMLEAHNPMPYMSAKPLVNLSALARQIHRLQSLGYTVNIISWLSKSGNASYNASVTAVKYAWLAKHLPSVCFDSVRIVPYGTPKSSLGLVGILFDDEQRNRDDWDSVGENVAYDAENILEILKSFS